MIEVNNKHLTHVDIMLLNHMRRVKKTLNLRWQNLTQSHDTRAKTHKHHIKGYELVFVRIVSNIIRVSIIYCRPA